MMAKSWIIFDYAGKNVGLLGNSLLAETIATGLRLATCPQGSTLPTDWDILVVCDMDVEVVRLAISKFRGRDIVIIGSLSLKNAQQLQQVADTCGHRMVIAHVFEEVEQNTLAIFSGNPTLEQTTIAILAPITPRCIFLGPDSQATPAMVALNSMISAGAAAATADVTRVAHVMGIDQGVLLAALSQSTGGSGATRYPATATRALRSHAETSALEDYLLLARQHEFSAPLGSALMNDLKAHDVPGSASRASKVSKQQDISGRLISVNQTQGNVT